MRQLTPGTGGLRLALQRGQGSVSDTYEYDTFGNIRSETGSSANEVETDAVVSECNTPSA